MNSPSQRPVTRQDGEENATLHALFPTLVYQNTIADHATFAPLFNEARQQYDFQPETGQGGKHYAGEYHGQILLHHADVLAPFFRELGHHVQLYLKTLGMKPELFELQCLKTWFVLCEPNNESADALVPHNHSGSDISWVYYVDVPADCPVIRFHSGGTPRTAPFESAFHYDWHNDRKSSINTINWWNADVWSIHPKSGDLLIFPGHQLHSVESNHTSQTRISIAGDVGVVLKPDHKDLEFGRTHPSHWKTLNAGSNESHQTDDQ